MAELLHFSNNTTIIFSENPSSDMAAANGFAGQVKHELWAHLDDWDSQIISYSYKEYFPTFLQGEPLYSKIQATKIKGSTKLLQI